jgi:putative peptidoglycan lipid II flippase
VGASPLEIAPTGARDMSVSTLRTSGRIAGGTLLSRLTGLVRVWATAHALGIGALTDTYNSANSTPNLIYELLLGGVLTASIVPLFVDITERDDRDAGAALFTTTMSALLAISGLAFVAAPWIVRVLTSEVGPADHGAALDLGTALMRCFALQIVGYGFTAVASAALNARGRFVAAAYAPVLNNVVVSAVLLLAVRDRPTLAAVDGDRPLTLALGLGTTAGILVMAIALVPALSRAGVSLRPVWQPRNPAVQRLFRQSGWTLGYVISNQIALFVVMVVAREVTGSLAAYQFAFVFFQLPHGLVAVSIMTAWLPELVQHARRGDLEAMGARFDAGLRSMLVLIVPSAAGFLALSVPIVDTLLTTNDTSPTATAAALTGFAIGLVPFSVYLFTLRGFYALGDTRTPFVVNALENALNVVFALVAFDRWGVRGLAGAFAAAYAVAAVVSLMLLRRRIGRFVSPGTPRLLGTLGIGGVACASAAWWVADRLARPGPGLILGGAAGALGYGAVVWLGARRELHAGFRPPKTEAPPEPANV